MNGEVRRDDSDVVLKVAAEMWLADFVASLGAQFPVLGADDDGSEGED
jgi:hypothetical protein